MNHLLFIPKIIILSTAVFFFLSQGLIAKQELILVELNPSSARLGVFNSYQHKLLLVSIVNKDKRLFDCLPNKYLIYSYKTEDFYEVLAGNLKVNSDFSKIFRTKIHTLGGVDQSNRKELTRRIRELMAGFNVSPQTMEAGKMISFDNSTVCWQQPELLSIQNKVLKSFPYLVANLCKKIWCSELYWVNSSRMQFWVQINPKEFHLVSLDINTGIVDYKKHGPAFFHSELVQMNAPRENLITQKNMVGKTIMLDSGKGKNIKISWTKAKNGKITVTLRRDSSNKQAVKNIKIKISNLIKQKKIPQALQLIKFAFWLDPGNTEVKMERLKAFASLLLLGKFYYSLQHDFMESELFGACQKLHLDQAFRNLWKKEEFIQRFKKICSVVPKTS